MKEFAQHRQNYTGSDRPKLAGSNQRSGRSCCPTIDGVILELENGDEYVSEVIDHSRSFVLNNLPHLRRLSSRPRQPKFTT
jgi:hypothetical protein